MRESDIKDLNDLRRFIQQGIKRFEERIPLVRDISEAIAKDGAFFVNPEEPGKPIEIDWVIDEIREDIDRWKNTLSLIDTPSIQAMTVKDAIATTLSFLGRSATPSSRRVH
jgi:hypothetical protein